MDYPILSKINDPKDLKALPREELFVLAEEIRAFLCDKVTERGGHLASNLGVVELSLALHRVFSTPHDRIVFDVGHQSYVHKLLTGRRDAFDTLRVPGGLSGFTKRSESEHDAFGAGHSSTSISAALGLAEADKLSGSDAYTVAVVGDGAYTGGMIHEALNNCKRDLRLIIVLNENEMSISQNTGGFAEQISRIRTSKGYYSAKRRVIRFLRKIPFIGPPIYRFIGGVKQLMKNAVYGTTYFEELGLEYFGPVDGNDYEKVERLLYEAKQSGRAGIVHIKTTKGKGYAPAETEPAKYHGIPPAGTRSVPNFSGRVGETLTELARDNEDICAITAAMSDGTGLEPFAKAYPKRFYDVGIAEEHAVTFAAGLAAGGKRPYFAVYSSFLQRAYDNVLHDVALQGLPVTFCIDRASLSAGDGPTHHGIYDVAMLGTVPGMELYAPCTFEKLDKVLRDTLSAEGPVAIRYPNAGELELSCFKDLGELRYDYEGSEPETVLITYGRILCEAMKARAKENFGIILLEKLMPYDDIGKRILSILPKSCKKVIFLEEGQRNGGAAQSLRPYLSRYDYRVLAIDGFGAGKAGEDLLKTCKISSYDIIEELNR